jgi:ATP-dependent Clp protease ATP-binding subunit ClpA
MLGEVITRAFELADERREMLGTEHLLLVLAEQASTTACNILERHGLTRSAIEDILNEPRSASAPTSPP